MKINMFKLIKISNNLFDLIQFLQDTIVVCKNKFWCFECGANVIFNMKDNYPYGIIQCIEYAKHFRCVTENTMLYKSKINPLQFLIIVYGFIHDFTYNQIQ